MTSQRLSYSVGFTLPAHTPDLLELIPADVWAPALDAHDEIRDGAWVAELTDLLHLTGWPKGMRVIVRKERPHPGAQLTITARRRAPHHRVRHEYQNWWARHPAARPRNPSPAPRPLRGPNPGRQSSPSARAPGGTPTGLRAFPLFDFAQNQIWCAIVALALEITAWTGDARPGRTRRTPVGTQEVAAAPGGTSQRPGAGGVTVPATLARTGRRVLLHLAAKAPGPSSPDKESHDYAPWPTPADPRVPSRQPLHHPRNLEPRPPETTLGSLSDPNDRIPPTKRPGSHHDQGQSPHERSRLEVVADASRTKVSSRGQISAVTSTDENLTPKRDAPSICTLGYPMRIVPELGRSMAVRDMCGHRMHQAMQ